MADDIKPGDAQIKRTPAVNIDASLMYLWNEDIHAAVNVVADISIRYSDHANTDKEAARNELFDNLIRFFGEYDRIRTDQVQSLKTRLSEEIKWSVRPLATTLCDSENRGG